MHGSRHLLLLFYCTTYIYTYYYTQSGGTEEGSKVGIVYVYVYCIVPISTNKYRYHWDERCRQYCYKIGVKNEEMFNLPFKSPIFPADSMYPKIWFRVPDPSLLVLSTISQDLFKFPTTVYFSHLPPKLENILQYIRSDNWTMPVRQTVNDLRALFDSILQKAKNIYYLNKYTTRYFLSSEEDVRNTMWMRTWKDLVK